MNLHESKEFNEAISKASEFLKIRPLLIEKDYWVTFLLRNLSLSEFKSNVVFKGGTSLSKAYNCIDRFSEDVDLAILKVESQNDNQLKSMMKSIEHNITVGLSYVEKHPSEEKRGRNRRTFYNYPKALVDKEFGEVKETLQLEINTFTNPVPHEIAGIESYVALYFRTNGFEKLIAQYSLQPFELNVLTRERTFFEKLLSLIRLSYDGIDSIRGKIRHFYDLFKLFQQKDLQETILSEKSFELVDWVIKDDKANNIFTGNWLKHPLAESPLFKNLEAQWKELGPVYEKAIKDISWKEIPPAAEILGFLKTVKKFLEEYDKEKPPEKKN
jgi:predicted nucleotidyltransferase component of viral defense system